MWFGDFFFATFFKPYKLYKGIEVETFQDRPDGSVIPIDWLECFAVAWCSSGQRDLNVTTEKFTVLSKKIK